MTREEAYAYRHKIERAAASQSDEDALDSVELFITWDSLLDKGEQVPAKTRCQDGGILYECIQAHTPQSDWHPADTPALWKKVSIEEWPEWKQPTGAQDAYNKGDKVTFEGKHYMSLIDGNIWSPAAYPAGWEEQL